MTTAAAKVELLPCPIDSGQAEWREHPIRGTGSSGMEAPDLSIRCTVCGLETTRESTERWERGRGTYSIRDQAEAELLARWNTRALEAPHSMTEAIDYAFQIFARYATADEVRKLQELTAMQAARPIDRQEGGR